LLILAGCAPAAVEPTPTAKPIPYSTPEWFDNAVLYEIFVRSFADSDGDGIGDLNGIREQLDYIQSLSVDAIWLMPIYPSPSEHGYDVIDFFAVNPDYGTMEDLRQLTEEVHDRGMQIILDFVPSHLSNENPLFQDAYGNPDSELSEWFVFTNENNTSYAGFANSEHMPRFNHFNEEVVEYLKDAALFWMDLDEDGVFDDGIDGFRVDNATFPPTEFFTAFRETIKEANPDFLLLGETWVPDARTMSIYYEGQFDALFDFPLYSIMEGSQNSNGDGLLAGRSHPSLISTLFSEQEERYPPEAQVVHFLSNHDTNRIASEVKLDLDRQKLAATFLVCLPGPLMIYYGEEIGMLGNKGIAPYWDHYRREPMDWYASESGALMADWFKIEDRGNAPNDGISVEEQDVAPDSLLSHYRKVLGFRRQYEALDSGESQILELSSSGSGAFGIYRYAEDQQVVAVFNFGTEAQEISVDTFPFTSQTITDLLTGQEYLGAIEGASYSVELGPGTAIMLLGE
jgi:glycosidase